MNYKGHLIFGFFLGGIFILLMNKFFEWFSFNFLNIILYILIIFIFSLLPDCDTKAGKIVWVFFMIGLIGLIYGIIFDYKILIISIIFLVLVFISATSIPHRGLTHGLIFGGVVALPLYFYFGLPEFILALVSFQSHIWGDKYLFRLW